MDMTTCPECGMPAVIQWRAVLESTDGPVEHARTVCVQRHYMAGSVDSLWRQPVGRPAAVAVSERH